MFSALRAIESSTGAFFILTLFFQCLWAAALGFGFGFSKHNDFRRKSNARWAEHLPGKRGQVRWIGMKKSPVDFLIVTNGNGEQNTVLELFSFFFLSREKRNTERYEVFIFRLFLIGQNCFFSYYTPFFLID